MRILKDLIQKANSTKHRTLRYMELKRLKRIRKHNIPQYSHCKNCGEKLHGIYCSRCGQYALDINQNAGKYIKQFFENTYQLDGKIVQTVRSLALRPGFLTNEFIAGKINSYVHPMKLFMFLSVIFFSFILMIYSNYDLYGKINANDKRIAESNTTLSKDSLEILRREILPLVGADSVKLSSSLERILSKPSNKEEAKEKETVRKQAITMGYQQTFSMITKYMPIILLLLIPVYGWIMWKSYKKYMPNYMHNIVFSFHTHCLLLIFISSAVLTYYWLHINISLWLLIIFLLYHIIAVKNVYKRGWISSTIKSAVNLSIYAIITMLVFAIFLIISIISVTNQIMNS